MLSALQAHLPLAITAVLSLVVIVYLWRELNKARAALRAAAEQCGEAFTDPGAATDSVVDQEPPKRVHFADEAQGADTKPRRRPDRAALAPPPAAAREAAAATPGGGALESSK